MPNLHCTLGTRFQEDDSRLLRDHAVTGILRRAAITMLGTLQQEYRTNLSKWISKGQGPNPSDLA